MPTMRPPSKRPGSSLTGTMSNYGIATEWSSDSHKSQSEGNKSRDELEKKIEQSRRLAAEPIDDLSKERLKKLVEELEKLLLGLK